MSNINFASQGGQLEKKTAISTGNSILIPSIILFLCLAAYGGVFFWKKTVDAQLSQVEQGIKQETEKAAKNNYAAIFDFQARLDTADNLLEDRISLGSDLAMVQQLMIPEVSLTSFGYTEEGRIVLGCLTNDYHAVARQLKAIKDSENVSVFKLEESAMPRGEEGVTFATSFMLKEEVK